MKPTIEGLIEGHTNKLDTSTQLLADVYAEVNASDDPRPMLNAKTLEVALTGPSWYTKHYLKNSKMKHHKILQK